MIKLTHVSLLLLSCVSIASCFTNDDFFKAIKDHVTDIKIDYDGPSCERLVDSDHIKNDRTLCDGIVDIPGAPTDEFDSDFFLKEIGFAPYESVEQCSSHKKEDVDETLRVVSKYCHYKQYLANGLQDIDSTQDQNKDENVDSFHFHIHFHHHCHRRNYVNCKCRGTECSCCLNRKLRFNYCIYRYTFNLNACIVIKYKGKKPCPTTTTKTPATTTKKTCHHTTSTVAPPTTTVKPTTAKPATTAKPTTVTPPTTTVKPTTAKPATTAKPTTVAPPTTTTVQTPPPREEYQNVNEDLLTCPESLYDVTFKVNGHTINEFSVTTDHMKPLCYNIHCTRGYIKACIDFYSVNTRTGHVCIRLNATWTIRHRCTRLSLNVGCMTLPSYKKADLLDILSNEIDWDTLISDQELQE